MANLVNKFRRTSSNITPPPPAPASVKEPAKELSNTVVVLIEAAKGDIRNRNPQDAVAISGGLLIGKIQRIVKNGSIIFSTRDGNEVVADILPDQRLAMDLGPIECERICDMFMDLQAAENGRRAAEITFTFEESVDVNSQGTIVTKGHVIGEFSAPKGQAIGSEAEYKAKVAEVIQASKDYRAVKREAMKTSMAAAFGVAAEAVAAALPKQPATTETTEFDPNQAM